MDIVSLLFFRCFYAVWIVITTFLLALSSFVTFVSPPLPQKSIILYLLRIKVDLLNTVEVLVGWRLADSIFLKVPWD